eukprot:g31482.t1
MAAASASEWGSAKRGGKRLLFLPHPQLVPTANTYYTADLVTNSSVWNSSFSVKSYCIYNISEKPHGSPCSGLTNPRCSTQPSTREK